MLGSGKSTLTHGGDTLGGGLTDKFIARGRRWNGFGRRGKARGEKYFCTQKRWLKPDKAGFLLQAVGGWLKQ
jgi:hypothetical protein